MDNSDLVRMANQITAYFAVYPKGEALAITATMVGGLTLSRALRGSDLSDEFLQSCRRHIEGILR